MNDKKDLVPTPCDDVIYIKGEVVALFEAGMVAMQGLIDEANRHTEHKMDWHYVAGRAVVKTVGDPIQARKVLMRSIPREL